MRPNQRRPDGRRAIKHSRWRLGALVAVVAILPALTLPAAASARAKKVTLIGSGSSAAQPYMELLFSKYEKLHRNIRFKYNPDGGNQGVKDVQNHVSEFAINTAFTPAQGTGIAPLMYDALCIDVNSANKIGSISIPNLRDIYAGTTLNWSASLGSNLTTAIQPQGRNSSAGQYTFFTQSVMGTTKYATGVSQFPTDGQVANSVIRDKSAIGYVGLANSRRKGEKALKIATKNGGTAWACSAANVRTRKYPLWRFDYGIWSATKPNARVLAFFNWITDSKAAARVVNRAGAVATPKHKFGHSI